MAGIIPDLLSIISTNSGIQLEPIATSSYGESLERFAQGECDIISMTVADGYKYSQHRTMTQAIFTTELGFAISSERHDVTAPDELAGKRLGVVRGPDYSDLLQRFTQGELIDFQTIHQGMEAVLAKDIDAMVAPLMVLKDDVAHHGTDFLRIGGGLGIHHDYALMLGPSHHQLQPLLNTAISHISEEQRQEIIHRHLHRERDERGLQYLVLGLTLAALLLLLLFYRNRYLWQHSRELEDSLQDSEKRFERLAENAPDMLFRMSLPDGKYDYVSPAAFAISGYTQEEFLATPQLIACLAHNEWEDYVSERWSCAIQGTAPAGCEFQIVHKSGELRWVSQRCTIIKDEAGNAIAMEGIISDITERKQMDAALQESERRYRNLIDSSPDWIWEVNAEARYTYASPRIKELLGYTPEEVIGKTPFDLMSPSEVERVGALFAEIVKDKSDFKNLENTNRHKAGHLVVLETSGVPILSEKGQLLGYRGIDRDITQRKENEYQLRVERDFNNTILESAGNIIAVIDMQGNFVRFNRAAEKLTGYECDEVIGRPVWELVIPQEQREGVHGVFDNLRQGKVAIAAEYENEWLTRDGGRRHLKWHNTVLRDDEGKVSYIVALGYDITEQRETEREHQRLQRELQQAQKMESLGQLTGGIAHDFNNLLGIISGYAGLVYDSHLQRGEEKLVGYMKHLKEATDRATKLVAQMLAFSRSDPADDAPIQLVPLVKEDIKMLRATLPSTIEMDSVIETKLPPVVMNPTHLNQILMNLVINARDAMNGVGKLHIKLGWARGLDVESPISHKPVKGDWIELSVADSGCGIDDETAKHIFNPFFTTKEVGKGTGMGLSVIYGIMENHGGHILLESKPGQGSTFRMLFPPYLKAHALDETSASEGAEVPRGNGEEILVVDDELSLSVFMTEMLSSFGYRASGCSDGMEALQLFQQNPERFSLVITDQTMPGMTGTELIERLRELRANLPAILCTGYSDKIDASGADKISIPYFPKPIDANTILRRIAELLRPQHDGVMPNKPEDIL